MSATLDDLNKELQEIKIILRNAYGIYKEEIELQNEINAKK